MAVAEVIKYFEDNQLSFNIMELDASTATVQDAAIAHNVDPDRIAKSIALQAGDRRILLVTSGTSRIDNKRFKALFSVKPRMLKAEDVLIATGHPVGGVCPFGLRTEMEVFLDISLKAYETVFPAAGAPNASVEIEPETLREITHAAWVEVCRMPETTE
jgi:prolyl-tRNA editing enzyme YbaK/EbsC (Cys-tRNA(Pro) deacylase)